MNILGQIIFQGINLLFVSLLVAVGWMLHAMHLQGDLLVLFIVIFIITVFPLYTYYIERAYKRIVPLKYEDLYIQTVDMFLSLQSFDDIIKVIFDKVLQYIGVKSGLLIFYSHATDDYTIYYQKQQKQKIIRKAHIDKNNIILKIIQSGDDILIKSKMDPSLHFQRTIIFEMEKLGAEIIIPIYYHNIFLGLMILGEMKMRISKRDILMLKALASKIAIVMVNSFFTHELLKSKEIEKEYELGYKVLKQFLSPFEGMIQTSKYFVINKEEGDTKYYFHVYNSDPVTSYIMVCHLKANISLLSLLIPATTVLLQSYARLGFLPDRMVKKINEVLQKKELIEEHLPLVIIKKRNRQYCISKSTTFTMNIFVQKSSKISLVQYTKGITLIKNPQCLFVTTKDMVANITDSDYMCEGDTLSRIFNMTKNDFIMAIKE